MGLRSCALSAGVKLRCKNYKREREISPPNVTLVLFLWKIFTFRIAMDPCFVIGLALFSKLFSWVDATSGWPREVSRRLFLAGFGDLSNTVWVTLVLEKVLQNSSRNEFCRRKTRCFCWTKEARLILPIFVMMLPILRKTRPSFLRVLHTMLRLS